MSRVHPTARDLQSQLQPRRHNTKTPLPTPSHTDAPPTSRLEVVSRKMSAQGSVVGDDDFRLRCQQGGRLLMTVPGGHSKCADDRRNRTDVLAASSGQWTRPYYTCELLQVGRAHRCFRRAEASLVKCNPNLVEPSTSRPQTCSERANTARSATKLCRFEPKLGHVKPKMGVG